MRATPARSEVLERFVDLSQLEVAQEVRRVALLLRRADLAASLKVLEVARVELVLQLRDERRHHALALDLVPPHAAA